VNLIARTLAGHPAAIEDVNGREVGLELAREWMRSLAYGSLFGPWSVKVVNELDRCSKDAQDMLLTYLDRMKPGHAFLGTTNLDPGSLTERFQTRFQSVRLQPPEKEVLAAFLARRWDAPITITRLQPRCARAAVRGVAWTIDQGPVCRSALHDETSTRPHARRRSVFFCRLVFCSQGGDGDA